MVTRRNAAVGERMMLVSLTATAAAVLMALNFYLVRCQFDPSWWIPNAWLVLFPAVALSTLISSSRFQTESGD